MIPLKNTEKGSKRDLGTRYTKAIDRHAQLERELARVMNRWQKSRTVLKRLEKRLDEEVMDDPARYAYNADETYNLNEADEAQAAMWDANAAYLDDPI